MLETILLLLKGLKEHYFNWCDNQNQSLASSCFDGAAGLMTCPIIKCLPASSIAACQMYWPIPEYVPRKPCILPFIFIFASLVYSLTCWHPIHFLFISSIVFPSIYPDFLTPTIILPKFCLFPVSIFFIIRFSFSPEISPVISISTSLKLLICLNFYLSPVTILC